MSYAAIGYKLHQGQLLNPDGGTGNEPERRGMPMNSEAWCGVAAAEHRVVLRGIHIGLRDIHTRFAVHPPIQIKCLQAAANIGSGE